MKLDYPILIFRYGIGEWKTKGRYIQHVVVFCLSCFHLAIEKTKMGITDHMSIFRFFVWGLEKRKRMLSYPFSIFYYEIEKRKTNGRYIHGPKTLYIYFCSRIHTVSFSPCPDWVLFHFVSRSGLANLRMRRIRKVKHSNLIGLDLVRSRQKLDLKAIRNIMGATKIPAPNKCVGNVFQIYVEEGNIGAEIFVMPLVTMYEAICSEMLVGVHICEYL